MVGKLIVSVEQGSDIFSIEKTGGSWRVFKNNSLLATCVNYNAARTIMESLLIAGC